jgi:predicted protein tyrosine phosphatase
MYRQNTPPLGRVYRGKRVDLLVLSRAEAATVAPDEPYILVSVTDPNSDAATFAQSSHLRAVLRLQFHDIAGVTNPILKPFADSNEVAMSDEDGSSVVAFVRRFVPNEAQFVVVHCEAGISRSAGIAAAVSKIWNGADNFYFERYLPNSWVYRQVLAHHATLVDSESES